MKCTPVEIFDAGVREQLDDMVESMLSVNGAGLAAPQLGIMRRMVVLKVYGEGVSDLRVRPHHIIKLVNPTIVELSDDLQIEIGEGCLSLPNYWQPMQRRTFCRVRAQDEQGRFFDIGGDGFLAIQLQHELEHLDGTTLADHLSTLKRDMLRSRFQKAKKAGLRYVVPETTA